MKVVVIEDEKKARNGLVNLIQKLKPNYKTIKVATNGMDGITLIEETHPSIIFLDIIMPKLNGLDMLKKINDPDITRRTIILSGYSEFEYAQTAVQLGVKEYLLKPITISDLESTLNSVEKEILEESIFDNLTKTTSENILIKLLNGHEFDIEEVRRYMSEIKGFNLNKSFTIISLYLDQNDTHYQSEIEKLLSTEKKQANNLLLFGKLDHQNEWIIIQQNKTTHETDHCIPKKVKQINENIITFVTKAKDFYEIQTTVHSIKRNRKWSIILKNKQIITGDLISQMKNLIEPFIYPVEIEQKAISAISSSNPLLVTDYIINFKDYIFQKTYNPQKIIDSCYRFFSVLLHSAILIHPQIFSLEEQQKLLNKLTEIQTPNELSNIFDKFIRTFSKSEHSIYSLTVYKAVSIIKEKYTEDLSLKEIAYELNVTPEYLSSLFNKEIGKPFTHYLKHLRILKARELLTKTESKVYEIGRKIGYTDPKYFTRVFKEITGLTPATYRKVYKT